MFKRVCVLRIKPGQEILQEILRYCEEKRIYSGVIISLLGSLSEVNLGILKGLPAKFISKKIKGPLEIGCGTGSIARKDGKTILHIHLVVSDENQAIAGHLAGGKVLSTAEVVIGELKEQLKRYKDPKTGLNELKDR